VEVRVGLAGRHADPDGDALTYSLLYSNDEGASWQAQATNLTGTGLELNTNQLPGGSGLLRVVASDGFFSAFDTGEPLTLDIEDQYRRSEEAYSGPEDLSALAYAGWDDEALYLAVEVTKPDLCFRTAGAPPLRLDNEPDDIHSDGLQVYLRDPDGPGVCGDRRPRLQTTLSGHSGHP